MSDAYVPFDAINHRSGTDVFINVPKLVVGKMGWDCAPSRQDRAEKNGPSVGSVDKLYGSFEPTDSQKEPELDRL